ncbi:MAG TPA: hypothetical protein VM913_06855 [Sphingomicrobium sp.]|jgi:hypothetical protein|nr:hypothetical protein [Sphingomicrobium sp.]
MRTFYLVASVAALAIAAPATAQKGGNGGDKGGGKPAKVERGGGGKSAKAERGRGGSKSAKAERGGGGGKSAKADRRKHGEMGQRGSQREAKAKRVRGPERQAKAERSRGPERREARVEKARGQDRDRFVREARVERDRDVRIDRRDDGLRDRDGFRFASNDRRNDGCPPGLAAKNNGCLPPGQAKQLIGRALPAAFAGSLLPAAYRAYYPDSDDYFYRSGDGLLYRIARSTGVVDGYSPLWGYGADYEPDYYYPGERYPLDYVSFYNVPAPYQRYYQDDDEWLYRYGEGGIYRVDRSNGVIDSIVTLLAGDLGVGQPLPAGYDVYNVPYDYRDEYQDTPDSWYRYNDGNIYQVDPKTRLIQAVIQALV